MWMQPHCLMRKSKRLLPGIRLSKKKLDLDIQVSKLQLLKQSYLSQKYEMEDKVMTYFPTAD